MTTPTMMAFAMVLALATVRHTGFDSRFSEEAAKNTLFEIQFGQMAMQWSPREQVIQFAHRMTDDYSDLNAQLKLIASKDGFTLPDTLGSENSAKIDRLIEISGGPLPPADLAFDEGYIEETIADLEMDIAAFQEESAMGLNADLRNWTKSALPVLREDLCLARSAEDYLSSVGQVFKKK